MKKRNLLQRAIIIGIVTVVGFYIVIGPHGRRPHAQDFTWRGLKANLANNIHLGLDLKGGSHLVMRVKVEEYLKRLTEDSAIAAQNAAKDAGFTVTEAHAETGNGNYRVLTTIADASKAKDVRAAVEKKVDVGENAGWSFSLENPETTITPFKGGAQIVTGDNSVPDFTAKYTWTQPCSSCSPSAATIPRSSQSKKRPMEVGKTMTRAPA